MGLHWSCNCDFDIAKVDCGFPIFLDDTFNDLFSPGH